MVSPSSTETKRDEEGTDNIYLRNTQCANALFQRRNFASIYITKDRSILCIWVTEAISIIYFANTKIN